MSTAADAGDGAAFPSRLDPAKSTLALFVGVKGSGKSDAASLLYGSWPADKLAVDVTKDAKVYDGRTKPHRVTPPLPGRLPERGDDGLPLNVVFQPDPRSPTFRDDLDRAVGMILYPRDRPILGWFDEMGEMTPGAQSAGPHMRTLLMQSRHYRASALMCCPRPMKIDPMCVSQADLVFVFELPNPRDRERIADNIGYPPARFHDECAETWRRGQHWFLLYDRRARRLWRCPPLPESPYQPHGAAA